MRAACVLLTALLCGADPAPAQLEEPYDPRKPPPEREIRALIKGVTCGCRRADRQERIAFLERLAEVNHHLTLRALVSCCAKAPREVCLHGLELVPLRGRSLLEKELPGLLHARSDDLPTYQACVRVAMERQVRSCLPQTGPPLASAFLSAGIPPTRRRPALASSAWKPWG